jgi:hypothetical protein
MAPIITHSLSLFNVNPIIKKSDASPIAPSNDQLVHCERSAAVDYIKSQWESVTSRAHQTINESGILVLVEVQPSTLENQTAEASIQKIESSYLSELDDQTIAPVAHQLVQISTVNKQDISNLFISHSSARPCSFHEQNEFDRTPTDAVLSLLGNNQTSQSFELINKNAASGPSIASNDTEQQQADNNNFILINANIKENNKQQRSSATKSKFVMTKTSAAEYEKMAKLLISRAQECRSYNLYTMACETIEEFELFSMSCPELMDRSAWRLRRSYVNCLKAECLTLDVSHPQWQSRLFEAYLLVTNVLTEKSAERMHLYATFIQMACEFLIKANSSGEIDSKDDEKLIESFMAELLDIIFKITNFVANVGSPDVVLREWNPPNWFANQRSAKQQQTHFFDTFSWIMALCAFSSEYVEDQLIYKRLFLRLGLNPDATWNEVVRAFRKQSLALHEDKNTPEMSEEEKADRKRRYLLIDEARNKLREKLVGVEDASMSSYEDDVRESQSNGTKSSGDKDNPKPRFNLSTKIERGPIKPLPGQKKSYSHVKSRVYNN